jgi:acyl-coenzyme A synthetase/AMP-(fatty) acid ligase
MIVAQNAVQVVLLAFAVARLGAIFTIINNSVKSYSLRRIVAQCEPALIVLDKTTSNLFDSVYEIDILQIEDVCDLSLHRISRDLEYRRQSDPAVTEFPGIDVDPVCLVYTSGSTGAPRGVVISHDNIRFSVAAIQERLKYRAQDVVGLFLPLSFDYGLYQVFLTANAGASIYIGSPSHVGPRLVSIMERHQITVLPGVPTLFAALLKLLGRRPHALPRLRCMTNTGEHLSSATIRQLVQYFPHLQFFPMYGLTECKRVSILLPDEMETRPDSVGRPLPGTEAYVVDEKGHRLPSDTVGELVVRGRHVTQGYWGAVDETNARFRPSVPGSPCELWTGDLCRVDSDGFLYFIGRNDSMLKRNGHRISPLDIEQAACSLDTVLEARVVKIDDGAVLHLFVTVSDAMLTKEQLIHNLQDILEPFKMPDQVHIVTDMPQTGHGKVDREQLKQLLMA